mmetsp:Transcript_33357/g.77486  ORF Transcript_33357/g.77486 Transcript_33357/m.77486 type:complete len:143 (+) Transcript_33357:49-477(+)
MGRGISEDTWRLGRHPPPAHNCAALAGIAARADAAAPRPIGSTARAQTWPSSPNERPSGAILVFGGRLLVVGCAYRNKGLKSFMLLLSGEDTPSARSLCDFLSAGRPVIGVEAVGLLGGESAQSDPPLLLALLGQTVSLAMP